MVRQAYSFESDAERAEPRFAMGTREIDRLRIQAIDDGELELDSSPALDLAAVPHALFVIGADGRIEDVNAAAEALVGYARHELVGQLMDRLVSDLACSASGTPRRLDAHIRFVPAASGACVHHRSGRELPVSVVLCPHRPGSVLAFVTPLAPVALDGLRQADLALIVHDLKNPLATIALEMCLLGDKLSGVSHADLRGSVRRVAHNVEFLDRMVQDLLDSCAIDAGNLALTRSPTELRALLVQIVDRVVPTRDRGRVFLEAPSALTLSIDALRIERVVANLISNALKYAPRTTSILVRFEVDGDVARVSVIDAGFGMTADEVTYIFDKYRRTSGARAHEGSGLGLYVSKQIIEAHGGRIGVDSKRGLGSRFFFELQAG